MTKALDALRGVKVPAEAAEMAAEALRSVNHLTIGAPAPGSLGWEDLGDRYRVLGELRVLAERLPQGINQRCCHLQQPAGGSWYRSDSSTQDSAETLVATAAMALEAGRVDAHQVGSQVGAAQSAVAHLAPLRGDAG